MQNPARLSLIPCVLLVLAAASGCQEQKKQRRITTTPGRTSAPMASPSPAAPRADRSHGKPTPIRQVVCLYDHKPWLNLDASGDRTPEGIQFRAFLVGSGDKGTLHDGTFHIDMYRISRNTDGTAERTLVSDWHYTTQEVPTVSGKILGKGYHLWLRWASKDIAGGEIEIVTQFEDAGGNRVRSGTKRLPVPKYDS